ncbi:MAG: C40 family peptidase [Cloacibacterium sp.]|jgi:hypothetical protein|nr:C40 family peptidase [Cloacibacterium sp.]
MEKTICNVIVSPLRRENSDKSEMVSQILYGEQVEVIDIKDNFTKIKMLFDGYEGWCDTKHLTKITDTNKRNILTKSFGVYDLPEGRSLLSIGSEVTFFEEENHLLENLSESLVETAKNFLNVPYLWGGRSFFGIDCSGFTQLVYKVHGISLPRDAYQQAEVGKVLDFVEESKPGDLAFFENEEGKIHHVGILLSPNEIIHASGKVRIDALDYSGIFNQEMNKHTHKLRFVKSYF